MNDQRDQSAETSPVGTPQGADPGSEELLRKILERLLKTREARLVMAEAVPVMMNIWAGESGWRRIVSKLAADTVIKGFSKVPESGEEEIEKLFEDPDFLDAVVELLTGLFTGIDDVLITGAQTLERMSPDEKNQIAT
jgi:hypothetical protein